VSRKIFDNPPGICDESASTVFKISKVPAFIAWHGGANGVAKAGEYSTVPRRRLHILLPFGGSRPGERRDDGADGLEVTATSAMWRPVLDGGRPMQASGAKVASEEERGTQF